MIAIDANIFVRYLVQDVVTQGAIATNLLENILTSENPGFVSLVAVLELDRVLRKP